MRTLPDDDTWAVTEFAEAELGDLRRTQRWIALATALAQRPGASLPEACGDRTFARVLGRYVRELGLLSLPQAVYKMTGGAAAALCLVERGLLREGYWADITLFDPHTILDNATIEAPHQYASGISMVLVNGDVVIDAGEHTGALPGQVLRRGPQGVSSRA